MSSGFPFTAAPGGAASRFIALLLLSVVAGLLPMAHASTKIRVLIVDGQNNHNVWPKSTAMMKSYLEETGKFEVDLARTRYTWKGEK